LITPLVDALRAQEFEPRADRAATSVGGSRNEVGLQAANRFRYMSSHHSSIGDFTVGGGIGGSGISKRAFRRRSKRQTRDAAERTRHEKRPAHGTLAQTRNLVMAALRVWELKRGIRD
jgi:hypothetical protein